MFKLETTMAKLIEDAHLSNPDVMAVLRRIAREHFAAIMGEHNRHYAFSDDTQHAYNMEAVQQAFTQKLEAVKRKSSLTLDEADRLYMLTTPYLEATDPPADHAMLSHLDWLLKRASLEATRIYIAKCNGDFGNAVIRDEVFTGIDPDIMPPDGDRIENGEWVGPPATLPKPPTLHPAPKPSIFKGELLDKALETYLSQKAGIGRDAKTVRDIQHSLNLFRLMHPSVERVTDITKERLADFESKLSLIPAEYGRNKTLKVMTFDQLLKADASHRRFSAASRDKHCINLRAFMRWLQEMDKIPVTVLPRMHSMDKLKGSEKKHAFSDSELATIFHSPQYTGHRPDGINKHRDEVGGVVTQDAYYWVPLIALYSGLRMAEIIQLYPQDIREEDGIVYMDINADGPDKSLKNPTSKRQVPIHPALLKLNFMKFVEDARKANKSRLFPEIEMGPDGRYSHNFSKHFSRYLESLGIKRRELTFHSFRHTFITTASRQKHIRDDMIDALAGHKTKAMSSVYRGRYTLAEKLEALTLIQYPHEVTRKLRPYKSV